MSDGALPRFRNPVLPGFHPDPSICRVGDDFFLATSSFHTWPGVPLFHSRDLVTWQPAGAVLTRRSQLDLTGCPSSLGIFAPTLRHHGGRFWMITTHVGLRRNFLVWAEDAAGPWSDPLWLDWPGIDPSLFFDDDGRCYLTGNGGFLGDEPTGIYQAEFDPFTGRLLSPRQLIWAGTGGKAPEGPHLYRRDGWVHLLIAEGGTEYGHMVTSARSRSPMGPFEPNPHNPVLSHRSTGEPLQATGHADLVQLADGHWWAVLLGIRPAPVQFGGLHHHLGREVLLAPVQWCEDGWPRIGNAHGVVSVDMPAPPLDGASMPPAAASRPCTACAPPSPWLTLRQPPDEHIDLSGLPERVVLHGQATSLDGTDGLVFLGRRQQHFEAEVTVHLHFSPTADGDEAGLCVYMNERFHYELALTRLNGVRQLIFRRRLGSLWRVEKAVPWRSTQALLRLQASASTYTFSAHSTEHLDGVDVPMGQGECAMLSSEVAGGFTGVVVGLYATGHGRAASAPACFDQFTYRADA